MKRKEQDGAELQQFLHWCAGTILFLIHGAPHQNICCFDDNWWKEEAIPKVSSPFNTLLHRAGLFLSGNPLAYKHKS